MSAQRDSFDSFDPFDPTDARAAQERARERLTEAAADRALFGGTATIDELELAEDLEVDLEQEEAAFEKCIALIAEANIARQRTSSHSERVEVPAELETKLHTLANALHPKLSIASLRPRPTLAATKRAEQPLTLTPRESRLRFDWLAAAACVALGAAAMFAVLRVNSQPAATSTATTTSIDPVAFLRTHPNAVHWPWAGTADSHVVGSVAGEAYFDAKTSEGLLVIEGLAPNDPTQEQYQLWIFDAARDERFPVDGGVFDVKPGTPTRIAVTAKLPVSTPNLFAVTVEKPGGAVVSDRRIALVAKP